MGRLPPRALASQRTLLLGGLLLPLALSSALREEVTKSAQGQNPKSTPFDDLCTTRTESIILENTDQNTTYHPNTTASQPVLTCSSHCPLCPPVTTCPSVCPVCAACPTCPTCRKTIPLGYEHFPGVGYYRLHTVLLDWFEAKATCEREGAHLAIINSQEEANVMKNLYARDPDIGRVIHVGFHDQYKEGKYVTVFGQLLVTTGYLNWEHGQPDNSEGKEHCGTMYASGTFNDINCDSKWAFVCELPE